MLRVDFAHSIIQFKAIDGEQRVLEGIATTPTPDRIGDVMDPAGATFALPLPLLWQHDKHKPIGHVIDARVTSAGIAIRAQIEKGVPFIDEAWALLKRGLVRGLSIGWRPLDAPEFVAGKAGGTTRYKRWEWLELSTVTVAMNAETTILSVKSADTAQRDALSGPPARTTAAVAGSAREPKMNYSEQIAAEKAELQSKSTRLEELEQQDSTDGGLGAEETTERDTLTKGIDALVAKIARLSTLESAQAMNAKTVSVPAPARLSNGHANASRIEVVKKQLPPATAFVRYVKAMAVGRGSARARIPIRSRMRGAGMPRRRKSLPTSRQSPARRSSGRRRGAGSSPMRRTSRPNSSTCCATRPSSGGSTTSETCRLTSASPSRRAARR
jgi:HK97 family phage prohead protease